MTGAIMTGAGMIGAGINLAIVMVVRNGSRKEQQSSGLRQVGKQL